MTKCNTGISKNTLASNSRLQGITGSVLKVHVAPTNIDTLWAFGHLGAQFQTVEKWNYSQISLVDFGCSWYEYGRFQSAHALPSLTKSLILVAELTRRRDQVSCLVSTWRAFTQLATNAILYVFKCLHCSDAASVRSQLQSYWFHEWTAGSTMFPPSIVLLL